MKNEFIHPDNPSIWQTSMTSGGDFVYKLLYNDEKIENYDMVFDRKSYALTRQQDPYGCNIFVHRGLEDCVRYAKAFSLYKDIEQLKKYVKLYHMNMDAMLTTHSNKYDVWHFQTDFECLWQEINFITEWLNKPVVTEKDFFKKLTEYVDSQPVKADLTDEEMEVVNA